MPFCHLHNHSHFSLLDGAQDLSLMVKRAKALGQSAVGLTDHGNLHGALKFYQECNKQGIKPVIGYEAYITQDMREKVKDPTHLTLLAKNNVGYRNLVKLASLASTVGFYYRPRIDRECLAAHAQGLIVLSGCIGSEVSRLVLNNELDKAKEVAAWYADLFGDDYYLEVQHNGTPAQARATSGIFQIGRSLSIPVVATADCHYTAPEDADLQDVMVCITTGKIRSMPKESPRLEENCYYLRDESEMRACFPDTPDAIERSQEIADKCNVEIETGVRHFPKYEVPSRLGQKRHTPEGHLRELCYEGMLKRMGQTNATYTGRLERELKVIHDLGFDEYFLVVADFCEWARNHGIYSTARGSGVGSLVCYLLGISHVDPIEYGLLFERFLDPSRREAPDIDCDFDKERRAEVMDYVKGKYGEDCACQIGTFGTFGAKMALKDVGKVECVQAAKIASLTELVSDLPTTTLASTIRDSEKYRELLDKDNQLKRLHNMADRIEGMAKSIGTHAAGVVISDKPLVNYVPLMKGKDGSTITQWDMNDCESAGLLKMDFLGLRNLTILSRCIQIIEERTGQRLDMHKLPMDDQAVFADLAAGETQGVFQLEPTGMTGLLIRMKPTTMENIIACIALYRPGPLDAGMVDEYVAVKNGEKQATYAHPAMEQILGYTYGVMVYQEQVMMVLNQVGGIPLSESYSCIKAISKKIKAKVDLYKPMFCEGCSKNGVDGEALWEQIGTFARYGFNKSHSTAYAFIAYQTAWLKHYFPVEFMAALLSCDIAQRSYTGRDALCSHLDDCKRQGIEVVMPDVNVCGSDFKVRDGKILFGLDAIKGVPHSASVAIAAAQPFTDLFDFCKRVPKAACPKAAVRNLILIGAMPGLQSRSDKIATLDRAIKLGAGEYKKPEKMDGKWGEGPEIDKAVYLNYERELTGIFISGHPTDEYPWMKMLNGPNSGTIDSTVAAGVITTIEKRQTHSGKAFVTFVLDTGHGSVECILWEPTPQIMVSVTDGRLCVVRGTSNRRGSNNTLTVHKVHDPVKYMAEYRLGILVDAPAVTGHVLSDIAKDFPGSDWLALRDRGHTFMLDADIEASEALVALLRGMPGVREVYTLEITRP